MYAVLETGGKQYKVAVGDRVRVSRMKSDLGAIKLDKVTALIDDEATMIGTPYVFGASISCTVLQHGMGKKVVAFHYKPKKRIRIKRGHRQPYTLIRVDAIESGK